MLLTSHEPLNSLRNRQRTTTGIASQLSCCCPVSRRYCSFGSADQPLHTLAVHRWGKLSGAASEAEGKKRESACQAESRQVRVCWQISQPAEAWTRRGGALEAQGKGLKILLTLMEGMGRGVLGENNCLVYISATLFLFSLWLCFSRYCSIRRSWEMYLGLAW